MAFISLGILAALAVASPDAAQPASPAAAEPKEAKADKPKMVCRKIEITGRRIPKRECKTEAQWAADTVNNGQDALRLRSADMNGN